MTVIRKSKSWNHGRDGSCFGTSFLYLKLIAFFGAVAILICQGCRYRDYTEIQLVFSDNTQQIETQQVEIQQVETQQVVKQQLNTSAITSSSKSPLPQKADREEESQVREEEESEKLAIVLFTHLSSTSTMERLIFPGLDTYYENETEPLFLVMTNQWKNAYEDLCHTHSAYCNRLKVLWVDCPEGYFGESPCCKQEKGLLQLLKLDRVYDWILFADDDTYFRMDFMKDLLFSRIHPTYNSTSQILFTGNGLAAKGLGQYGYQSRQKQPYICSPEYRYPWGQPVIYSKASLNLIKRGFELGGLVKQCLEYNVTHDVGNAIFHWMYGIPDIAFVVSTFPDGFIRAEILSVHGIDRIHRGKPTLTMHQVHDSLSPRIAWKKYHRRVNVRIGFNKTSTFQQFGHPSTWTDEWHTMPRRDCMDEETKKKAIERFGGLERKKRIRTKEMS